jgi:predicted HTH transcriptional regulator
MKNYKNKNDYCEIGEEIVWYINGTKFDSHELAAKYLEDMYKISKKEASKYLEELMLDGKVDRDISKSNSKTGIWQSIVNFFKGDK